MTSLQLNLKASFDCIESYHCKLTKIYLRMKFKVQYVYILLNAHEDFDVTLCNDNCTYIETSIYNNYEDCPNNKGNLYIQDVYCLTSKIY